jgi:uncharacterized protein (TIRG00374 family)
MTVGSEPVPRPTSARGFLRRHGAKTLFSLAIGAAFAWVLHSGGLPLVPARASFAKVRWELVLLHTVLLITVHTIRATRWRHLLRPIAPEITTRRVLAASWIGFTAILILPLRAGEIVRPWLVRDGRKVTRSNALGTIGAERVIDGLIVTVALACALLFVPRIDPLPVFYVGKVKVPVDAIPALGYTALAVFAGAFVAMGLFYFARRFTERLIGATLGRISATIAARITRIVSGLADGLHFLSQGRHAVPFVFESVVYWGLNAVGMWVLGMACGLPMTFGQAVAVMGVLALGILVPAGPGLFGAFQTATLGGLAMYFPLAMVWSEGAAYIFLLYVIQFVWHVAAAGIAWYLDRSLVGAAERAIEAPPAAELT